MHLPPGPGSVRLYFQDLTGKLEEPIYRAGEGLKYGLRAYIGLKFVNSDKQTTASKRHGIERETDKINQPRYFKTLVIFKKSKNIFIKWKSKILWRFVSTGKNKKEVVDLFHADQGRHSET